MKNSEDFSSPQSEKLQSEDPAEPVNTKFSQTLKQPNSRHCFVCGVENDYGLKLDFYQTGDGTVVVETIVPDQYQGYPGIAHGGIVASLVDEVLGRVHMGTDPENPRFMYTAKLTVQYRKPVPTNQRLTIRGFALKSKKRSATSRAEIIGPGGDILVEADAILINVPTETIKQVDLDTLGWKVYPTLERPYDS
jgi:acyl-coenzyme A thioesterase PaaI-like protein